MKGRLTDHAAVPTTPSRPGFTATALAPGDTVVPATAVPLGTPTITIIVSMSDMSFRPSELRVRSGETVHLELQNPDRLEHAIVIADADVAVVLSSGSEQSLDFVVDLPPGTYAIVCPISDEGGSHEASGMVGKLIVEAAP